MDLSADWKATTEPAGFPISFRVGVTGLGVGVGCGVGVGAGAPLNLGTVPILGQALHGISSGFAAIGGGIGAAGGSGIGPFIGHAKQLLRQAGVSGGLGCGVGLGYGFGAGFFLRPDALNSCSRQVRQVAGQVSRVLHDKVKTAGLTGVSPKPQTTAALLDGSLVQTATSNAEAPIPALGPSSTHSSQLRDAKQRELEDVRASREVMRTLLRQQRQLARHQRQINMLAKQNEELRCELRNRHRDATSKL